MTQRLLRGLAAAGGSAVGPALVVRDLEPDAKERVGGPAEQSRALAALALVAEELASWAEIARSEGRLEEAEILEANRLMADDPGLREQVLALAGEAPAELAVREVTARHALAIGSLSDPHLAARAADVREIGRRATRRLLGGGISMLPSSRVVVLARELGPADVTELQLTGGRALGIALAEGAATSHVAIMARSLGIPLVVGVGDELLTAADGDPVVLDGDDGLVVLAPSTRLRRRAQSAAGRRERDLRRLQASRGLPSVTRDGRPIRLLCNASTSGEVAAGLAAGAEGIGLLRTELAFFDSPSWPSESAHAATLRPILAQLEGRIATVRTLDFGEDKKPPFLAGISERGLELTLAHPESFEAQLRAILDTGRRTRLRLLFPFVRSSEELQGARVLLAEALAAVAWTGPAPQVGAMLETPEAVEGADEISAQADFLSIGTNDLVRYTLDLERGLPLASAEAAAHPAVLALVARAVEAAHASGIPVEVCGEAAGEPRVATLLVGLGVDELSAAPGRLDSLRDVVRGLSAEEAALAARSAVGGDSAAAALALGRGLLRSAEPGDQRDESGNGLKGILT
jgi:multiphosphoryl transfer protein